MITNDRAAGTEKKSLRPSLSPGCQKQTVHDPVCHFPKERGETAFLWRNTHSMCLINVNGLLVLISGSLPSRDSSGCWVSNSKRKISHKSALAMPGSLLQGISAVFFSQRRGLP